MVVARFLQSDSVAPSSDSGYDAPMAHRTHTRAHVRLRTGGFTIAELLIVVAIVGVLVAVAIPVFVAQLESAKEATCLANRRSMYAEVVTQTMDKDKELEKFNELNAQRDTLGYTCPDDGKWSWDKSTRTITCDKHPGDAENSGITTSKSYLADFKTLIANSGSTGKNDELRAEFINEHGTPKLSYDGKNYLVQPFYSENGKSAWLYAKTDDQKTGTNNWSGVSLIFNPVDNSWYRYLDWSGTKTDTTTFNLNWTEETLNESLTTEQRNNHPAWEKITDLTMTSQ